MTTATNPPPPPSGNMRRWPARATALLIVGVLLVLFSVLPLLGGIVAAALNARQGNDGFLRSPAVALSTEGFALTSPAADIRTDDAELRRELLTVQARVGAAEGDDVFLGIAEEDDVADYLRGVRRSVVEEVRLAPDAVEYRDIPGQRTPAAPDDEAFWVSAASGPGTQQIEIPLRSGDWVIVVMNSDASPGVRVDAHIGVRSPVLLPLATTLLTIGGLLLLGGAAMVVFGAIGLGSATTPGSREVPVREPGAPRTPLGAGANPTVYPARLTGHLSPQLSRALWLVKWLLAIPHYLIVVLLWVALAITSIVAFFAILFTGRYPRPLFDFNVGVLRWTWRVAFYSYSALATDEYPPFTLAATDYPADFDVAYPEHLSRGLVLVKWWLLAVPHLVIVGALTGGAAWVFDDDRYERVGGPSLLTVLVLIAAVILLFTGHYQRPIFDFVMGINRWIYRVLSYVLLFRDEYPPFRLDQGADEPQPPTSRQPGRDGQAPGR
jgi:hypothetical protein